MEREATAAEQVEINHAIEVLARVNLTISSTGQLTDTVGGAVIPRKGF